MADTPADKPKRRRTTKAGAADALAAKPARTTRAKAPAKAAEAAPRSRAKKIAPAPKAAEAKPKAAPRKRAAPKPEAAKAAPPPKPAPTPASAPAVEREAFPEPPKLGWMAALGAAAAVGGAWFVWRASRAEEPDYQTVESDGAIEVRKYPSLVTAATVTRGEREKALSEGFRTLADYIFAKSRPGPRLPMTAPVLSDAPSGNGWRTRFIMPRGKARAELPAAPEGVELASEPAARIAAIRFSGRADGETLDLKEMELRSWLQTKGLPHEGKAVHAFYNAPFLPGPFRRNEVLVRLSDEGGTG